MPFAFALRLDESTATEIDAMLQALPDRRIGSCLLHRSYPSHVTLAVYGDRVDVVDLDAVLATATGRWKKLPITLAGFGIFPGEVPTIWLAPVPTTDLLMRHTTLHRALADLACHPHYEVGAWIPHVSLGRTKLLSDAIEVVTSLWTGPISATLVCCGLTLSKYSVVVPCSVDADAAPLHQWLSTYAGHYFTDTRCTMVANRTHRGLRRCRRGRGAVDLVERADMQLSSTQDALRGWAYGKCRL